MIRRWPVFVVLWWAASVVAQTGSIVGRVADEAGQGLADANVLVKGGAMEKGMPTDGDGRYLVDKLPPGSYEITASFVGYQTAMKRVSLDSGPTELNFALAASPISMQQSVVSASRTSEKILNAPASVSVVESKEIQERPVLTVSEHIKALPGVDFVRTGLVQTNAVARGFNNVFSGALMVLTDNRLANVPSLRVNAYNFIPLANDDIERIEVVLGPNAALYGSNSTRGVLHFITRSPFSSQGTSVQMGGGERGLAKMGLRHAGVIGRKLGYKISAQYYQGTDWKYHDPVEEAARQLNPSLKPRDFDVRRQAAEVRLDYRPTAGLTVITTAGYNRGSYIEMTGLGAAQVDGWAYNYAQVRLRYGSWFAQVFRNWSDAGKTFLLRDGQPITDKSSLNCFQIQHQASLGKRQRFLYGFGALLTRPNTEGTITGRNEKNDDINELGWYLQSESALHPKVDLVLALRRDDHNRIEKAEWSPRAALVFKPTETQTLRLTYNRAFGTPSSNNLYLDLLSSADPFGVGRNFAPALGYSPAIDIRVQGKYREGYGPGLYFRRDTNGRPLFRSPFAQAARLAPDGFLPLDDPAFTNAMWGVGRQAVLAQFAPQFQGLVAQQLTASGMEAGAAAEQAKTLAAGLPGLLPAQLPNLKNSLMVLNLGKVQAGAANPFDPVADAVDVPGEVPGITQTYEMGYKGIIANKLVLAADVYRTKTKNFGGPLQVITPNVFLDPASLAAALGPALAAALQDPANAAVAQALGAMDNKTLGGNGNGSAIDELMSQVVGGVGRIPFGTVSPEQAFDPHAVILSYRQFGQVMVNGLDLSLAYYPMQTWSFTGNYSFVDDNFFKNVDKVADVSLNAPRHKVRVGSNYELPSWRLKVGGQARYNGSYQMESGVNVGKVRSYTLLDLNLVYKLPVQENLSLILNADNVLNNKHQEFVGAPEIGRLVFAQLGVSF